MEYVFWYFIIGTVVSSALCVLAAQHPFVKPTTLLWIIFTILWPIMLVKFAMNLASRG